MHYEPLCLNNKHKCKRICTSANCKIANAFVCEVCTNHHSEECQIIPYTELIKNMHLMQGLNSRQLCKYEDSVEQTFKLLIKSLQAQFIAFRNLYEHINANGRIADFYQMLKSHRQTSITGSKVREMLDDKFKPKNNYRLKSQAVMWTLSKQLVELQKKVNKKLPYYYSIYTDIEEEDLQENEDQDINPMKQVEIKFRRYRQQITGGMLEDNINNIEKIFDRDIYNIQLLYRASKYQFSARDFHKICDGKRNTLIIARTQYGNVVGGFCAIPWRSPPKWQYDEDPSNETFIFSLNKYYQGLKFSPFKRKFTVGMHRQYGPCFGDDLVIYDKSNTSKACWSNFPDCYTCPKKDIPHDFRSIKEFVGIDDHYKKFNITEWQVYKVSFNQTEQEERSFMIEYRKI